MLCGVASWRVFVSRDGNEVSLDNGDLSHQSRDGQCRRRKLRLTLILLFHQSMQTRQQLRLVCSMHSSSIHSLTAHHYHAFSALTLLAGRQKGHLLCKKTEWWGAGVVICLEQSADLHMAQLMLLPLTVCCSSKIQIGSTFMVLAHPGITGVCVCVCACDSPPLKWQHIPNTHVQHSHSLTVN